MPYNIIINVGNENMSNYVSTTLLFRFFEREDVLFYFFEENFDLPLEDKLSLVHTEVIFLLNPGQETAFNIIYYNSDYDIMLDGSIDENGLHVFSRKINELTEIYNELAVRHTINHLLIFHSPWFSTNDIREHDKFVNDYIDQVQHTNRLLIRNCSIHGTLPYKIDFYKMNLEGIKLIVKIIEDEDYFVKPDFYKNNEIVRQNAGFTQQQIYDYKHKLLCYGKRINCDIEISSKLYNKIVFWEGKTSKSKKVPIDKHVFKDLHEINNKNFISKWDDFLFNVNASIKKGTEWLEENNKFTFYFTPLKKHNSSIFSTNARGNMTPRNVLDAKIDTVKVDVGNNEIKEIKMLSKSKDIKEDCKNTLKSSKKEIRDMVRKLPNRESVNTFIAIIMLTAIVPLISMTYLLRFNVLNIVNLLVLFSLSVSIYVYFVVFKHKWVSKFYALVANVKQSILGIFNKAKDELENDNHDNLSSLNNYTIASYNYNMLVNEIKSKFEIAESENHKKRNIIAAILTGNELRGIQIRPDEPDTYANDDLGEEFFSNISIFNNL